MSVGAAKMASFGPGPGPSPAPPAGTAAGTAATLLLQSFNDFSAEYRASAGVVVGVLMMVCVLAVAVTAAALQRGAVHRGLPRRACTKATGLLFEGVVVGVTVVLVLALKKHTTAPNVEL